MALLGSRGTNVGLGSISRRFLLHYSMRPLSRPHIFIFKEVTLALKLTSSQAAVLAVLKQYGAVADHALVPLAQHQMGVHQSSSGIRSRRAELTSFGLVRQTGTTKTASGRKAAIYEAV